MSFTLPSHISQKEPDWYLYTTNDKFIHSKWIKWYCNKYWKSVDINPLTGKTIKRSVKKHHPAYVSKVDLDLEDRVVVVKQIYKEL